MFKRSKGKRIVEIDFLRGLAIFMMMIDHFFFDFLPGSVAQTFFPSFHEPIINCASWYWSNPLRVNIRLFFLALFLLISGISCYFSRNNLKRGLVVFAVGILINIGFAIYAYCLQSARDPMSILILFGPINCYGTCMLLYWLIKFLYDKFFPNHKEDFKWLLLTLGMAIFGIGIMFGVWGGYIKGQSQITPANVFLMIIGAIWHQSSDWMPLCPYFGIFLFGAFVGEVFYIEKKSYLKPLPTKEELRGYSGVYYGVIMPYKGFKNSITFIGRNAMYFYLLHQPAIIALWTVVLLCMGYKLVLPI